MFFSKKTSEPTGSPSWLIVGLGNPGKQYENTRHNAGFMALDEIAREYNADVKKLKFKAVVGDCRIGETRCLLMKPDTFMNNSGEAVVAAMQFYKIPIERVLVLFDDISLPPGKLRIRRKGSDGGHNGIKSIIYLTGSDGFPRIKIGVGAKPHPDYNLADWVLSAFKKEDLPQIKDAIGKCPDAVRLVIEGKTDEAMGKYNA